MKCADCLGDETKTNRTPGFLGGFADGPLGAKHQQT